MQLQDDMFQKNVKTHYYSLSCDSKDVLFEVAQIAMLATC